MTRKISRCFLIPLLVLTMLISTAILPGMAQEVWADSKTYDNSTSATWSFGHNLAGGDITTGSGKNISNTITVQLTEEEQMLADDGYLSYNASVDIGANGSRTVEANFHVKCFDASGNELTMGSYYKSADTYWVSHANYNYSSGQVVLPAGTAKLEYYAKVSIGTKGSLELEDMKFTIYNDLGDSGYVPIESVIDDKTIYEYYDADNKGSGYQTTYYDVFKDSSYAVTPLNNELLYKKAIINGDNLNRWAQLTYHILETNSDTYWDWAGNGFDKDYGEGNYLDLVYDLANKKSRGSSRSTGLQLASSFDDAIYKMLENQASIKNRKADADDFLKRHTDITLGSDGLDSEKQTVLYTAVSNSDQYGGTYKYGYTTIGIIFYDFAIAPLVDEKEYVTANQTVKAADENISSSTIINKGKTVTNHSKMIGVTDSTETSNTLTKTKETTMTHTVGGEFHFDAKFTKATQATVDGVGISKGSEVGGGFGVSYSFAMSELFGTSESNTYTTSKSETNEVSTSVDVPAYTVANITDATAKASTTLDYDCPCAITYKTAIVSMNGSYYDDNAAILDMTTADYNHYSFITVFGDELENAHLNLAKRADNIGSSGYESLHGYTILTSMDDGDIEDELWLQKVANNGKPSRSSDKDVYNPPLYTGAEVLDLLGTYAPMAVSGGSILTTASEVETVVDNYEAYMPLTQVWVTNIKSKLTENTIQVKPGDHYYLIDITTGGFNDDNYEYTGYKSEWGSWELLDDETGEPLSKDIAEIKVSATTGKETLYVYEDHEGIVLRYKIPEDKYKAYGQTEYTKNSDLKSTAYVYVETDEDWNILSAENYTDVNENAWYSDSVDYVSYASLMNGTGNKVFSPGDSATRAMIAMILWNASDQAEAASAADFTDLKQDWYKKAVAWASENGIVKGTAPDRFSPDSDITREQLAVFLYRYAQLREGIENIDAAPEVYTYAHWILDAGDVDLSAYTDAEKISGYAKKAVQWAVREGIIKGNPDGTINPQGTATRAEIATMIARFM